MERRLIARRSWRWLLTRRDWRSRGTMIWVISTMITTFICISSAKTFTNARIVTWVWWELASWLYRLTLSSDTAVAKDAALNKITIFWYFKLVVENYDKHNQFDGPLLEFIPEILVLSFIEILILLVYLFLSFIGEYFLYQCIKNTLNLYRSVSRLLLSIVINTIYSYINYKEPVTANASKILQYSLRKTIIPIAVLPILRV